MEGMEGVPMTNNVPVAVTQNNSGPESTGGFKEDIGELSIDKAGNPEAQADVQLGQQKQNKSVADRLFDSAKSEGADIALEKFAGDGFEEDEESMKTDKNQPQEEIRDGDVEKESNPLDQKVEDLESRVSELLSKNADLTERLEKTQEHLDMILKTGYELVQVLKVLKKLIEEEKDEKKKKSLLEILILLMGRLLQEVIDPETEREDNNKPVEKAA
ncbi:MAG: hypothetical protein COX79_00410 [Candidatus Levybacteria bacterium CG_4_10_14_0_2_um_filter_36_16]|nr:MAG: hypothetical protein AUK12_04340 [Candidatus Levybacteria bacterium CG2_30_37_29]PIR79530.1 MAG: hypothetical protein COU26_00660 [Candidatus Levybacteria bacterium CG10_big_fil_rev_8_21_14_0_10_36_30]PIZ97944.1 MAG: hypothetical protein COX79_00410 [Candidatus Levybacteria bacterium CG_4_10_14_0_2_um_filter_36_16]PJA90865.1 MAG: hypothetical protein CO136_00310 [Candidatus Levybacteria bacterium CG_4_9_14_3_um_filter_36_7]